MGKDSIAASSLGGDIAAAAFSSFANLALESIVGVKLLGGAAEITKKTKTSTTVVISVAKTKLKIVISKAK
jgi:hypothetical protein